MLLRRLHRLAGGKAATSLTTWSKITEGQAGCDSVWMDDPSPDLSFPCSVPKLTAISSQSHQVAAIRLPLPSN
ncbi:hypothetical protein BS17DRAFT_9378 [Gyrodon lividus]|nr:hypothetical protein BS17DRAFT_9378 [Gyrodon lividus]